MKIQLSELVQYKMDILVISFPQRSTDFWGKIFGHEMCQTWSKELEIEGIRVLHKGFHLGFFR